MKSMQPYVAMSLGVLFVAAFAAPGSLCAAELGVLGLFEVADEAAFEQGLVDFESVLPRRGCVLWRQGRIVGDASGSLETGRADTFLLLRCGESLLATASARAVFEPLRATSENLVVVEGRLEGIDDRVLSSSGAGRAYLLKLSRYNNRDPDRRDLDLSAINEKAASLEGGFRTEALVYGTRALGMPTPDEVAVLFYESARQGARFRESHPEILAKVGEFNQAHLVDFVYLGAASNR